MMKEVNVRKIIVILKEFTQNMIKKHVIKYSDDPCNVDLQQVWKIKGKLWPKVVPSLPAAKKDQTGKLVTEPSELKSSEPRSGLFRE